jgi:hypothetical protein
MGAPALSATRGAEGLPKGNPQSSRAPSPMGETRRFRPSMYPRPTGVVDSLVIAKSAQPLAQM